MTRVFKKLKVPLDTEIEDLWQSIWGASAVAVCMKSGITEALNRSNSSTKELAFSLNLNPKFTESILRVLVAMGFAWERSGKFGLTDDSKAYLVPSNELYRGPQLWQYFETSQYKFIYERLINKRPPKHTFGDDWKTGTGENRRAKNGAVGMDSVIKASAISIARSGVFEGTSKLLDVGGGSGAYATSITEEVKDLEAVVFDLPTMCYQAEKFIKKRGSKRVSTHSGDFFDDNWPSDCDGILFSNVLHDWPIKEVQNLLRRARKFISKNGRIFIHEALLDKNRCSPLMVTIFDLQMQMGFGGSQFTYEEMSKLLQEAGFGKPKIVAKFGYYSLLQAKTN